MVVFASSRAPSSVSGLDNPFEIFRQLRVGPAVLARGQLKEAQLSSLSISSSSHADCRAAMSSRMDLRTDRPYLCAVTAAFPVCGWYVTEDGRKLPANEYRELPDDGEWDFSDYVNVSLAELSETIAPLLKRGTLELVSVNGSRHETLAIHSDGCVQRYVLECEECESFQPEQTLEPDVESEERSASLQDSVAKPMGSGAVINEQADDGSAALTAPDPNKRRVGAERTMPDNEIIVPKTREEYVAEFLQLYEKSAAAKKPRHRPRRAYRKRST
jgi:hypothetical protein